MACAAPALGIGGSGGLLFGLGNNHWFLFVVVTFLKIEMIFTIVATILYIVAFIVLLSGFGWCTTSYPKGTHFCDARVTGGVFGIFNSVAYGIGAYLVYNEFCSTPPELQ